jgi:hypothetical protein
MINWASGKKLKDRIRADQIYFVRSIGVKKKELAKRLT